MSSKILDCQALPCPEPVLRAKFYLAAHDVETLTILVDNDPAKENILRFMQSQGFACQAAGQKNLWKITATKEATYGTTEPVQIQSPGTLPECAETQVLPQREKTLVLITSSTLGQGEETLGRNLMRNFLATLPEFGESLWRIILLNSGVTLAAENSPVLKQLTDLEAAGVSILVCGTCLDHYALLDAKRVGQTTNMLDVVTSIQHAEKIVQL